MEMPLSPKDSSIDPSGPDWDLLATVELYLLLVNWVSSTVVKRKRVLVVGEERQGQS